MRVERHQVVRRETMAELAARKAAALAEAQRRYPGAAVSIAAYYAGTFYVEIRERGRRAAPVVPTDA